jgi:hypothetical protein
MGNKSRFSLLLFGCHWFSEGDVKLVVAASRIQNAVQKFLVKEYQIITEELGKDVTIQHRIKYTDGNCHITIDVRWPNQPHELVIKGFVGLVKFPKSPKYVQEIVKSEKTSIQTDSVTQMDDPEYAGEKFIIKTDNIEFVREYPDLT